MTGWSDEHEVDDVERSLMLRAVARFSDDCEAPELTPECPFYEVGPAGPVCGEQCQDLIAKFPSDLVRPDSLGLGTGLAARRSRRPRRGPAPDSKAFDAAEVRMSDRSLPLDEQRLPALLGTLRAVATRDPATHNVDLNELLAEIEHRGVDIRTVARLGLSDDFFRYVVLTLWSTDAGVGLPEALLKSLQVTGHQWRDVLKEAGGLADTASGAHVNGVGKTLITSWFTQTNIDESLGGRVPSAAELLDLSDHPSDVGDDLVLDAEWLFDRFTKTYTAEWREPSLMREWRYLNTQRVGCCPPGLMRQRMVDELDVARALADEQCNRHEAEASQPPWRQLKAQAYAAALEGRVELAADIFGVVAELDPTDNEVMNNLGFCRMPSSPAGAVEALRQATSNTDTPMLTALNLSLAMHLVGDPAAQDVAEAALGAELVEGRRAYVWLINDGGLALELTNDLIQYGETLVDHMGSCHGGCVQTAPVSAP